MSSNKSIIIKDHSNSNESENNQKVNGVDYLNIGVLKVKEESYLHEYYLVAVIGFFWNVLAVYERYWVTIVKEFKREIDNQPIE